MSGHVRIGLAAFSDKYDTDDDRWLRQVGDLVHDLRLETEAVQIARTPVPGTKGSVDELILTLGSAGVFTLVVDVLRTWLGRDKTRSVELVYRGRDGLEQQLRVVATDATDEIFAPLLAAVADQISAVP